METPAAIAIPHVRGSNLHLSSSTAEAIWRARNGTPPMAATTKGRTQHERLPSFHQFHAVIIPHARRPQAAPSATDNRVKPISTPVGQGPNIAMPGTAGGVEGVGEVVTHGCGAGCGGDACKRACAGAVGCSCGDRFCSGGCGCGSPVNDRACEAAGNGCATPTSTGQPQCGQARAWSLTLPPHLTHFMRGGIASFGQKASKKGDL
jgi:hypothetical protein